MPGLSNRLDVRHGQRVDIVGLFWFVRLEQVVFCNSFPDGGGRELAFGCKFNVQICSAVVMQLTQCHDGVILSEYTAAIHGDNIGTLDLAQCSLVGREQTRSGSVSFDV